MDYYSSLIQIPAPFVRHFTYATEGINYRLCADALTRVINELFPCPCENVPNSVEAILEKGFDALNQLPPSTFHLDLPLSWRLYSDLIALASDFTFVALTVFDPRVDFYYGSVVVPDIKEPEKISTISMITDGLFAGSQGRLVAIHTDLLNEMHANLQQMPDYQTPLRGVSLSQGRVALNPANAARRGPP